MIATTLLSHGAEKIMLIVEKSNCVLGFRFLLTEPN